MEWTYQPPVMLESDERMSHDLAGPSTPYGRSHMAPVPPALEVMVITTATEQVRTRTIRSAKASPRRTMGAYRTWLRRTT